MAGQWFPAWGPNVQGGGPPDLETQIRGLIDALGVSMLNTNQQMGNMANVINASAFQANAAVGQMAQTLQQQSQQAQDGHGSSGSRDAGGYRSLKAKKEISVITAENASTLMFELDQFDVDLGELGIPVQSESAYRHIRSACTGKARDVLDLEIEHDQGKALRLALEDAIRNNSGAVARDYAGGRLHMHCVQSLENSVRLTKDKRTQIAQEYYAEAKMSDDTIREAEEFLCKWRRARRLLYREGLVKPSGEHIVGLAQQQGCSGEFMQMLLFLYVLML